MILTLSDNDIPPAIQKMIANGESEINSDDASRLIGCINALSKQVLGDNGLVKSTDPDPMRRAVAFCPRIKDSKKITTIFNETSNDYLWALSEEKQKEMVQVGAKHIDGSMSAPQRDELLSWLKDENTEPNECRILTNVRCLSEGVDVPSLDSVMFLSPRNSQVDVVQSVGRVMRRSPGKKYGYIIIPVVVPSDIEADKALDDNARFKVVWTVLNALRAHDDRFEAMINKIKLNKTLPSMVNVLGVGATDGGFHEGDSSSDGGVRDDGTAFQSPENLNRQLELALQFEQLQSAVFARMVLKVGDRRYWEQWASSVAEIAERQTARILKLVQEDKEHKKAFADFLEGLQKNINPTITLQQAIEMLSQHTITKPVFEALFEGYSFVKNNPISISMQAMLDLLEGQALEKDTATMDKFYESVKKRVEGIDNAEGKQRIIVELYDRFFKTAFPKMVEQLGIVYTPVEVVDFIVHSVNDVLRKEFGRSISDENIHILDPFTGTGTFITRLIQSGLIDSKDLKRKYETEIHANEIVLLAYYIAAVNIENAFHDATENAEYIPFNGICLTDTFQLGETDASERLFSELFPQNSARVAKQKKAPLRVIMGNPPYSVGQKSANDNAQNQSYDKLDARIAATYAEATNATNKNSLYDSYIKAFRWSTDRLDPKNGGIVCFVSNGAWLDGNAQDGFRNSLENEFSAIYVFNLRGNARTQGELRRKEAGNVFGSGSRTPISVTLLVKNPGNQKGKAKIHYHDIGDYLSRDEKLQIVSKLKSFGSAEMELDALEPNEHGDWLNLRNDAFGEFFAIGDKNDKTNKETFFMSTYSNGVKTNRDAWVYNSSIDSLKKNMQGAIDFYNTQLEDYHSAISGTQPIPLKTFLTYDAKKIAWTGAVENSLSKNIVLKYDLNCVYESIYRPYFKQKLYFSREWNERVYQFPKLFPTSKTKNLVICVSGVGVTKPFSCIISGMLPDLELIGKSQCFPLHYFEERKKDTPSLFEKGGDSEYLKRDGISDFIWKRAQKAYGKKVGKEDIFYYVYGFLHSPEYREAFANDLKKMLPRLPLVDEARDFWKFSKAGRSLAELHINYEIVAPHPDVTVNGEASGFFKVEKMRFPKKGIKDKIIYNSKITLENIPEKAYEYIVNGKSAIEWIMDRYRITTHKTSGIRNDPNDWATEVGNERYILDLLLSIVNVSVQTVDIVAKLPKIKF